MLWYSNIHWECRSLSGLAFSLRKWGMSSQVSLVCLGYLGVLLGVVVFFFCILVHWFSLPHFALACPPHTVTPIISHCKVFETTLFYTFFALFFLKKSPFRGFWWLLKTLQLWFQSNNDPTRKIFLCRLYFFYSQLVSHTCGNLFFPE